jgi:hypothetical protein
MANPKGNPETLKVPTSAEARINGRKGGKASGQARKEKATLKKAVEWLLNSDIKMTKGTMVEALKNQGIDITKLSSGQQATIGLWYGAVTGNATNFKTLMEVNGEIVEETPTFNPSIEEVEEIVDNSNLEKVLYEANKPE